MIRLLIAPAALRLRDAELGGVQVRVVLLHEDVLVDHHGGPCRPRRSPELRLVRTAVPLGAQVVWVGLHAMVEPIDSLGVAIVGDWSSQLPSSRR